MRKSFFKDCIVVLVATLFITFSLYAVVIDLRARSADHASKLMEKRSLRRTNLKSIDQHQHGQMYEMVSSAVPQVLPAMIGSVDRIKWRDILFFLVAWAAGTFFNESMGRIRKEFYRK